MPPGQDPRDLRSLMPWMDMATDAFETWMGLWTGRGAGTAGGKASPLLEMQRQMLQAWAAPWMALGMPGFAMPDAARPEAPEPAPRTAPWAAPWAAPQPAPRPAPAEDLPWSTGPAAPVAVMGTPAPVAAPPAPHTPRAEPPRAEPPRAQTRPSPVRHAEAAAPARRPRKAHKATPKLRAASSERTPATSGRRIAKPPRKPTH